MIHKPTLIRKLKESHFDSSQQTLTTEHRLRSRSFGSWVHTAQGKQNGLHSIWGSARLKEMEKAWEVATGDSVTDSGTGDMGNDNRQHRLGLYHMSCCELSTFEQLHGQMCRYRIWEPPSYLRVQESADWEVYLKRHGVHTMNAKALCRAHVCTLSANPIC